MVDLFIRLCDREIFPYLFCFNPEPDSRLGHEPKSSITRWRRIQLAKHLIELEGFRWDRFEFDDDGFLINIEAGHDDRVVEAMALDKKNRGGAIRIAPVADLGRVEVRGEAWTAAVPAEVMRAAVAEAV